MSARIRLVGWQVQPVVMADDGENLTPVQVSGRMIPAADLDVVVLDQLPRVRELHRVPVRRRAPDQHHGEDDDRERQGTESGNPRNQRVDLATSDRTGW